MRRCFLPPAWAGVLLGLMLGVLLPAARGQSPLNDALTDAFRLEGIAAKATGSNVGATREPGEPRHAGLSGANSVWWTWTAPQDGVAAVDLKGSFRAAVVAVYLGKYVDTLSLVASNSFLNTDGTGRVRFDARSGSTYQIAVDGDQPGRTGVVQLDFLVTAHDQPPELVTQPLDKDVIEGVDSPSLDVTVRSATPVVYDWRLNGVSLPDGTNRVLALPQVRLDQAGAYQVIASNDGGSVTSRVAQVVVHARPVNDDFARAPGLSGPDVTAEGSTVNSTLEAGEPLGALGSRSSIWWRWTTPVVQAATEVSLAGSFPDATVDIFTGSEVTRLVLVASDVRINGDGTAKRMFHPSTNTTYYIRVGTLLRSQGRQGAVKLRISQVSGALWPEILSSPADMEVTEREGNPRLEVVAWSPTALNYQWRWNGAAIPGATNSILRLPQIQQSQAGSYDVVVGNAGGKAASSSFRITVHPREVNDDFAERIVLSGAEVSADGDNGHATVESIELGLAGGNVTKSIWWSWVAPESGAVAVDLLGSFSNARLDIFTGTKLLDLKASDVAAAVNPDRTSVVRLRVSGGTNYFLRVSLSAGFDASLAGVVKLKIQRLGADLPPEIRVDPVDVQAVEREGNPKFEVQAWSVSALSYQWRFNETPIVGATNSTLVLGRVRADQEGDYDVVVANAGGTLTSRKAHLTVLPRPANDDFAGRILLTGASVTAAGTTERSSRETNEPPATPQLGGSVWWSWTAPVSGVAEVDLAGSVGDATASVFRGASLDLLAVEASIVRTNSDGTARHVFTAVRGVEYAIRVGYVSRVGLVKLRVALMVPPQVGTQPLDQDLGLGETAFLEVSAVGEGPFSFAWNFNGNRIPGATGSSLVVSNLSVVNRGAYAAEILNDGGSVTSRVAQVRLASVIAGVVTDAIDNHPLGGVLVSVGGQSGYTDDLGRYRLTGMSATPGPRVEFTATPLTGDSPLTVQFTNLTVLEGLGLRARTNGYSAYDDATIRPVSLGVLTNNFAISPLLDPGSMRLVLNWRANPRDLDAHLLTPAIDGLFYHIDYHRAANGDPAIVPYARLDFDYTNGFGPETLTVSKFAPGTYRYYVQLFAGDGGLAGSGATTRLYTADGDPRNIVIPAVGTGRYWHVCDVEGLTRAITIVNQIVPAPPRAVGATLMEASPGRSVMASEATGSGGSGFRYLWDFGDGTTSAEESPTVVYPKAGEYTVRLEATAPDGTVGSLTRTNYIVVRDPVAPPVVSDPKDVVIVTVGADPELDALTRALADWSAAGATGLSWRVVPRAGVTSQLLALHRLVIWDDMGGAGPLTGDELGMLQGAHDSGIPVWFMGPGVAHSGDGLSETLRAGWYRLMHLTPSGGAATGTVIEPVAGADAAAIFGGRFGAVATLPAGAGVAEGRAMSDAVALARVGTSDVLVASPPASALDPSLPRSLTQLFASPAGGTAEADAKRLSYFRNAVCWLFACDSCTRVSLTAETSIGGEVRAGVPVSLTVTLGNSGECDASAYQARITLAGGLQLVGGSTDYGWLQVEAGVVTVRAERLVSGDRFVLVLAVNPTISGNLTNIVEVRSLAVPLRRTEWVLSSAGDRAPELRIALGLGGDLKLQVTAEPGRSYLLERATQAGGNGPYQWSTATSFQYSPPVFEWHDRVVKTNAAMLYRVRSAP